MTAYAHKPRVGDSDKVSTALGVNAAGPFRTTDTNKCVKLGAAHNYILVTAGDELEAVVLSMEPHTVNNGFSFGTIQTGGRLVAKVDSAAVALKDLIVAGAQAALGTVQDYPVVRKGVPTAIRWRVIDLLTGTGQVGELVVIERL